MSLSRESLARLLMKAIAGGGSHVGPSPGHWAWDISGRCQMPVTREIWSRESVRVKAARHVPKKIPVSLDPVADLECEILRLFSRKGKLHVAPVRGALLRLDLTARCRRCDWCRDQRRKDWRRRAMNEVKTAERTWFLSLTFQPDHRVGSLARARDRLAKQGFDFDTLGQREQYEELVRECTPETQRFIKRVRRNSGRKCRYLLVWEAHSDGFPHAHMLLHEVDGPITWRTITGAWCAGFSNVKLVEMSDPRVASYVTKYIAKSAQTRVRASSAYGAVDSWRCDADAEDCGASPIGVPYGLKP